MALIDTRGAQNVKTTWSIGSLAVSYNQTYLYPLISNSPRIYAVCSHLYEITTDTIHFGEKLIKLTMKKLLNILFQLVVSEMYHLARHWQLTPVIIAT
jgi:hypothetical protein